MSLSQILLALTLILWGLSLLGWIALSTAGLGGFALVTGVLLLFEGFGVFSWHTSRIKRVQS